MTEHEFPQDLPPRPNSQTGEPRPPHAPGFRLDDEENQRSREPDPKHKPESPPGLGPALAWYKSSKKAALQAYVWGVVIVAIGGTIVVWLKGYEPFIWVTWWPFWLVLLGGPALAALSIRGDVCAAGADWLSYGKRNWVHLYDLTRVTMHSYTSSIELRLKDKHGRELGISTLLLQNDRQIWDLVYNGIIHSVANGAATNMHARKALRLPDDSGA